MNTTEFFYDANGQRTLTIQPDGTEIYTPFPQFEEIIPPSGPATQRDNYFLAGQLMAVRTKTGAITTLHFTYADHLGTVTVYAGTNGVPVANSLARHEPFGGYRTAPTGTNPNITDRGFTGHKHNNTGSNDLDLIYMNARYYLPEIGRFINPDSIVPNPQDPQSANRYSYSLNNPIGNTDPSGHCAVDASGNIALDSGGNLAKTDCTVQDFQNLSWDQRMQWLSIFTRQFRLEIWFDDIMGAIRILSSDADYQQMSGWAAYADAAVLQAINDGMRLYLGQNAIGSAVSDAHTYSLINGGIAWNEFFHGFYSGMRTSNLNGLIVLRLAGEQGGVDYAISLSGTQSRYGAEDSRTQLKIGLFLWGTNGYRAIGQRCRGNNSCNVFSSYTDPREATETRLFRVLGQLPEPVSWMIYGLHVTAPHPIGLR